jgi:YesN/AraC family two-component response regulator
VDDLKEIKLLYAEDDDKVRGELLNILKDYVKEIYGAKDGLEALELYKKHKPDIILSDIRMPKLSGLDLIKKIKDDDHNKICILITAYSDEFNLMEAIEIGVNSYINKPTRPFELLRNLENFSKMILRSRKSITEDKLSRYNMLLKAKMETLKDISHHWRQPLNAIAILLSEIEQCLMEDNLDKKLMVDDIKHAQYLVQDLSSAITHFSKIYTKDREKVTNEKLINLITPALFVLNVYLKENNMEVVVNIDENISIDCEPKYFTQSVVAIIKNSLEAKQEHNLSSGRVDIVAIESKDDILIEITDNCRGIEDKLLNKVFEPYFSTKLPLNNRGNSLFLVKTYFESRLGAKVGATNSDDGFKIYMNLPKHRD